MDPEKKPEDFFDKVYDIPKSPEQPGNEDDNWESEEERWKNFDEENRERALELLGLNREYETLADGEKLKFLKSLERIKAFDSIDTSTNPRKEKIEQKKGIVSEVIKRGLTSDEILKKFPMLYLGSGDDIEYPLTLGARKIIMVDPIFNYSEAKKDLLNRLKSLTGRELDFQNNNLAFEFNFGEGPEKVILEISPLVFNPPDEESGKYVSPKEIGAILFFAAQGPKGSITLDRETQASVVNNGFILSEDFFQKKIVGDNWENIQLGQEK